MGRKKRHKGRRRKRDCEDGGRKKKDKAQSASKTEQGTRRRNIREVGRALRSGAQSHPAEHSACGQVLADSPLAADPRQMNRRGRGGGGGEAPVSVYPVSFSCFCRAHSALSSALLRYHVPCLLPHVCILCGALTSAASSHPPPLRVTAMSLLTHAASDHPAAHSPRPSSRRRELCAGGRKHLTHWWPCP